LLPALGWHQHPWLDRLDSGQLPQVRQAFQRVGDPAGLRRDPAGVRRVGQRLLDHKPGALDHRVLSYPSVFCTLARRRRMG